MPLKDHNDLTFAYVKLSMQATKEKCLSTLNIMNNQQSGLLPDH